MRWEWSTPGCWCRASGVPGAEHSTPSPGIAQASGSRGGPSVAAVNSRLGLVDSWINCRLCLFWSSSTATTESKIGHETARRRRLGHNLSKFKLSIDRKRRLLLFFSGPRFLGRQPPNARPSATGEAVQCTSRRRADSGLTRRRSHGQPPPLSHPPRPAPGSGHRASDPRSTREPYSTHCPPWALRPRPRPGTGIGISTSVSLPARPGTLNNSPGPCRKP